MLDPTDLEELEKQPRIPSVIPPGYHVMLNNGKPMLYWVGYPTREEYLRMLEEDPDTAREYEEAVNFAGNWWETFLAIMGNTGKNKKSREQQEVEARRKLDKQRLLDAIFGSAK